MKLSGLEPLVLNENMNFINVGVDESVLTNESQVSIWPNPASDYVQVSFSSTKEAQNVNVLDAYGRIVLTNLSAGSKKDITIGIQDLASGVYYLSSSDQHQLVGRFIVNKQ